MSDPTNRILGRNAPQGPAMAAAQEIRQPPSLRDHTLTEEQVVIARSKIDEIQQMFPEEWHERIHLLTYQKILQDNVDANDLDVWKARYEDLLEEEGRMQIRLRTRGPFTDQLNHMLRLCGLSHRHWHLLLNTVVFDATDNYKKKVDRMVEACRYQGFDPAVLLKRIIKCWNDGKRAPYQEFKITYEGPDGAEEWTYNNKAKLIDDITFLITIFLNRGAVVDKILKKSANDFSLLLRMLVAKYQIRANEAPTRRVRAEALGPEIITLPRLAACFAQLTTCLFQSGHGRVIVSMADFPPPCPMVIFSPMFPSVVRMGYKQGQAMINIHPQLVLIAILVDNVLHIRDRVTPLDQIWTYYLAAHNSSVMLREARIEQCDMFGVTHEGRFIEELLNKRDHCIQRIKEMRPHERIDDFIREMNTLE